MIRDLKADSGRLDDRADSFTLSPYPFCRFVTVQTHLKLEVFFAAFFAKNPSCMAQTHSQSVLRTAKRIGIAARNVTCTRPSRERVQE